MNKKQIEFKKDVYSGIKGKLIIMLMNQLHKSVHKWLVQQMNIKSGQSVLDVGCGGGALIASLSKKNNLKTYGIDYSIDMVKAATKKNSKNIECGSVGLTKASVSEIPYNDNQFNSIIAFETIQFWPDIINDLKEVKRVLEEEGKFYIMNRLPKDSSRWYEFAKLKSSSDYKTALEQAGFCDIIIDTTSKRGWIFLTASL